MFVRAERGSGVVVALDPWRIGRLREPGEVGILAHPVGRIGGARREFAQAVVACPVRDGDADPSVPDGAKRHDCVVDKCRLMLRRRREASEAGALRVHEDVSPVGGGGRVLERDARDVDRVQARTPTWTPRKRAGQVPWETCAAWPGCPLPQFVKPCRRHSSRPATASIEPQNCGVMPV